MYAQTFFIICCTILYINISIYAHLTGVFNGSVQLNLGIARKLRVKFGGGYSKFIEGTSEVMQGSVLGPAIHNWLLKPPRVWCGYVWGRRGNLVENWESSWYSKFAKWHWSPASLVPGALMKFTTEKPVIRRLHPRPVNDSYVQDQLDGELLRYVTHQHALGVVVDETLMPHRQCAKAVKNADSNGHDGNTFSVTYPHLKYSLQAWRPWLKKGIKPQEDVQRC